jgi:hypothetical protein
MLSPTAYSLYEYFRLLENNNFLLLRCDWDSNVNKGKLFSFPRQVPTGFGAQYAQNRMELNRRRVKFMLCLCSAKVDSVWMYASTSPYVVMACSLGTCIFS